MLSFRRGEWNGYELIMVYSGVGPVNAAIAAELMSECFGAGAIIDAGTSGGLSHDVRIMDTVVSERVSYHDLRPISSRSTIHGLLRTASALIPGSWLWPGNSAAKPDTRPVRGYCGRIFIHRMERAGRDKKAPRSPCRGYGISCCCPGVPCQQDPVPERPDHYGYGRA